jgi:protein-disulfide isomerase
MMIRATLLALVPLLLAAASPEIDKGKAIGNPNAPVVVEIYSDFQCPGCKVLHEQVLPQLVRDYALKNKVYVVHREFPLPQHAHSREAANYAVAAARFGKYDAVASVLFKNQTAWETSGRLWDFVASVLTEAERKKIEALVKDPGVTAEVQREQAAGVAASIIQTPTVIVSKGTDHYPVAGVGPANYNLLRQLIDGLAK